MWKMSEEEKRDRKGMRGFTAVGLSAGDTAGKDHANENIYSILAENTDMGGGEATCCYLQVFGPISIHLYLRLTSENSL